MEPPKEAASRPYQSSQNTSKRARGFIGSYDLGSQRVAYKLIAKKKTRRNYKAIITFPPIDQIHKAELKLDNLRVEDFCRLEESEFLRTIQVTVAANPSGAERKYSVILRRKQPSSESNVKPAESPVPARFAAGRIRKSSYTELKIPTKYFDFISVMNALDLALAFSKGNQNEYLKKIVNEMVTLFEGTSIPRTDTIREMVRLLPYLTFELRYAIIHKFIKDIDIDNDKMSNPQCAFALIESLHALLRAIYQKIIALPTETPSAQSEAWKRLRARPAGTFSAQDLLSMVTVIKQKLPASMAQSSFDLEPDKVIYIEALVSILEMMEMAQLIDVEKDIYHKSFYDTLDSCDLHPNLKLAFWANYGKQLLTRVPDDETKLHNFIERIGRVIVGCGAIAVGIKIDNSTLITNGLSSMKDVFRIEDGEKRWFKQLYAIRTACFKDIKCVQGLKALIDRANKAYENEKTAKSDETEALTLVKSLENHNPFFIRALVLLLKELVSEYVETDFESGRQAIQLLQKFCLDNLIRGKTKDRLFTVHMDFYRTIKQFTKRNIPSIVKTGDVEARNGSYASQLHLEICDILYSFALHHDQEQIRREAKKAIETIHYEKTQEKLKLPSPRPVKFPNVLFEKAVATACPWQPGIRALRNKLLIDKQLITELPYHVNLRAQIKSENSNDQPIELNEAFDDFMSIPLEDNVVRAMLLTGYAGSGKSLSLKILAQKIWQKHIDSELRGESSEFVLPIFISLGTIKDPKRTVIEVLEGVGLLPFINLLKEGVICSTLFIFDGVDETDIGKRMNWITVNELSTWKKCRVIISIRQDVLGEKEPKFSYPDGITTANFTQLELCPFDEDQRREYIDQFLAQISEENKGKWKTQDYMNYISSHPSLQKTVSTPLYTRVTVLALPKIVDRNKEEPRDANIESYEIMDAYYCYLVAREQHRQLVDSEVYIPEDKVGDYLDYSLRVAEIIQNYRSQHSNAWIPEEEAVQLYPELFNREKRTEILQRCSNLIRIQIRDKYYWGYYHILFQEHFLMLLTSRERRKELEDHLKTGSPYFKALFT